MCGIAGLFYSDRAKAVDAGLLNRMTDSLVHRGPDDKGVFIDRNLGLGFRRLSIIDLSEAGHQPMFNEDRTICIVCNGEIYNFQELRSALAKKGHRFLSRTDTEAIVHAYEEYGAECLNYIDGMFAFAIWDSKKRQLFLARDRFGIKPLHYYHKNGIFAFGSEIKAILPVPEVDRKMDNQALWNYFSLMHIPSPQTIYGDIRKFLPAQAVLIKEGGPTRWWRYWEPHIEEDNSKTEDEWIEELKELFTDSIKRHLIADVPVGCFLSGGIDSSAIVAFASKIKKEPINTYSVSFVHDGANFDESPRQRLVAGRFQTHHHEVKVRADILGNADLLIKECDEPFAVPSAIALYEICKLASKDVKVVLSGDGGDELFAGYANRYDRDKVFGWSGILPAHARGLLRDISGAMPPGLDKILPFKKMRTFLEHSSMSDSERYARLLSIYSLRQKTAIFKPDFIKDISNEISNEYYADAWAPKLLNIRGKINRRLYYDIKTSLPDEMLTKMDRCASMVSIEGRVPFLNMRFAECAMRIPLKFKFSANNGKTIFKKLLKDVLPQEVIECKKQGFSVPVENWLFSYNEEPEHNKAIFNRDYIEGMRRTYKRGDMRFGYQFWLLKCFSVWENLTYGCDSQSKFFL